MKNWIIGIIVVLVVVLGFIALSGSSDTTSTSDGDTLDIASEITLQDLDGNSVSVLADHVGKARVVNTWATWCPFCVNELPDFVALQEEFGEEIVVVAVNRQESVDIQEEFLAEIDARDGLLYLRDKSDSFYKGIGGFSMPETLFINERDEIVKHKRGFMDMDEMRSLVNETLAS